MKRLIVLTAAFTPMIAVAALPVTVILAAISSVIANITARWFGFILFVAAVTGLGHITARMAAGFGGVPAVRGWRRWFPLASTVVVLGAALTEMVSGSRAPDPVIVLWFAALAWIAAFVPLTAGVWDRARRALWAVGPSVTLVVIVFLWTQGFFSFRFNQALSELDAIADRAAAGAEIADGTRAGGFVLHRVNQRGDIEGNAECDLAFWITGWHQEDTRYIVRCLADPTGDFTHLAGDWWQLDDRGRPSDL